MQFWLWMIAVVSLQPVAMLSDGNTGSVLIVGPWIFELFAGAATLGAWVGSSLRQRHNSGQSHQNVSIHAADMGAIQHNGSNGGGEG